MHKLRSVVGWVGCLVSVAGAMQACGSDEAVVHSGAAGERSTQAGEGGMVAASSGAGSGAAGSTMAGSANGGHETAGETSVGAAGTTGVGGGSGGDAGANGSAGAGGNDGFICHISWTGAATGEADCSHLGVCHHNFLSLGIIEPNPLTPPLKSIQLIYSPTELTLGKFTAADMDMVNCNVQTSDAGVSYAPTYDAENHLSNGTSMTGTLTDLQFSSDENAPCSGTAHGAFDVVLPQTTNAAKTLALHVDF
jgi:hypothetical protein